MLNANAMVKPRYYKPKWSPELEGYAYNAIRRRWPQLAPWYEWEDLMQEAQLVYLVCAKRYNGRVDNPAWFMALFKTAWQRRLADLIKAIPKYSLLEGLDVDSMQTTGATDMLVDLSIKASRLPLYLKLALSDLCRPHPRLKLSRQRQAVLRTALLKAD
jgi:hypothetical protein